MHKIYPFFFKKIDGVSWKQAIKDGWVPGKTLFDIDTAISKGTVIMNLVSDAGQKENWPQIKKGLTKGKTLYFSHGFGIIYSDQTGYKYFFMRSLELIINFL